MFAAFGYSKCTNVSAFVDFSWIHNSDTSQRDCRLSFFFFFYRLQRLVPKGKSGINKVVLPLFTFGSDPRFGRKENSRQNIRCTRLQLCGTRIYYNRLCFNFVRMLLYMCAGRQQSNDTEHCGLFYIFVAIKKNKQ